MTKIFAHRGASAYAPENTVEAFALAMEMCIRDRHNWDAFEKTKTEKNRCFFLQDCAIVDNTDNKKEKWGKRNERKSKRKTNRRQKVL